MQGLDEAVMRNIEAVRELAKIVRTSMGPHGMNKMVINSLEKLFVTNDAATILNELDVFHPAAKLVVLAAQRQEEELGDATNFVIVFAGELLSQAESLLRMGLNVNDVMIGFEKANAQSMEILDRLVVKNVENISSIEDITTAIKTPIASKQFGWEDTIAPVVAKACSQVLNKRGQINVDHVRVAKILGGGISDMEVISGIVMERGAEGTVKHLKNAKIAVFPQGIDYSKTDAKEVFQVLTPEQLSGFASNQEAYMEKVVEEIAKSGANLLVSGNKISDMAMHFIEKHGLMVIKSLSKFELERICRATGATPLVRLGAPTKEEMGEADSVSVEEIGSTRVTLIKREGKSKVATVLCRGATQNILDDIERAINDAVNAYKALLSDSRLLPGAGASEIELSKQLKAIGEATPGQDQYSIRKFGEALEVVPRTLAENSGHDATAVISKIYAAHAAGHAKHGLNVESGEIVDAEAMGVLDLLSAKKRAIQLAVEAAITILKVDQIIMAKPAIGPKPPKMGPMDAD